MKKILALALVLVLALGMMVPASAATAKITAVNYVGNPTFSYDLHPGESVFLTFEFSHFDYNSEVATFLANAATGTNWFSSYEKALLKLAKSVDVRVRHRIGGTVFDSVGVDSIIWKSFASFSDAEVAQVAALFEALHAGYAPLTVAEYKTLFEKGTVTVGADVYTLTGPQRTDLTACYREVLYDLGFDAVAFTVELECIDPFVSVKKIEDFEIDVYFSIADTRTDEDFYWTIYGDFSNYVTEVFADSVEADSWEGQVIHAKEYVGKIALVANEAEDVIFHVKMPNDKKIYAVVNTDGDSKDEPIMNQYPSIEWAYTVLSVGLSGTTGNFVELAGVDSDYYVYGKNADGSLKYLGRGGELMPFSAKYYISSAKLDLVSTDVDEEIDDLPTEEETVPSYNPSTGI